MKQLEDFIKKSAQPKEFSTPHEAGYDAGVNGANTTNSHFGWFSTKEKSDEWSRGNKAGLAINKTKK